MIMKIHSKKFRLILLFSFAILVFYLLFISAINPFRNKRIFEVIAEQSEANQKIQIMKTKFIGRFSENYTTLCEGNLLDQREYEFAKDANGGSYDNSRLISKMGSCQLFHYNFEQTVDCIDALYERNYPSNLNSSHILNDINNRPNKNLHFAFIGDFRIRQQYLNFVKLIPDYDRKSLPSPIPISFHGDIEVTSDILKLHISFIWQPLINVTIIDKISQWETDERQSDRPHLIVIGIALWHMLKSKGADHQLYKKKLKRLALFLGQLANVSQVIWLNQYPAIESFGNIDAPNTDIFSEKIHHYNQAVRRILGDHKNVRIWDSSNPLAEEYVRGCALSQRVQLGTYTFVDPADSYVNCLDYIHPGYSALSQSTQLLFNFICNNFFELQYDSNVNI